jgi:hypothetical protein
MTINQYRLETKTTEAIINLCVKLRVKHNLVCTNDISTQTVLRSVVTSISRRVVSEYINNIYFRRASDHYRRCSQKNLQYTLKLSSLK